jgi:hypothetical protein
MSKHSYLKIHRPCDVDVEQVLFKKRISIGEGIYEYPISYLNKPLIIQTPIIYIPYSTYRTDNKITFDFFFSNLPSEKEILDLYELVTELDSKVIYKINCKPKIKSGRKRQRKSPKRDFISNVKKTKQSCIIDKPDKMRVSFLDNIRVFNNLSQPISIDNVKGKTNMKLLLSPSKIWVNKNKFGIFWEVLQIKIYPKTVLNTYMFLEDKNPNCTCKCACGATQNNKINPYINDPQYTVYFDMIKKGVPKQAVINKMIMENKDPTVLEKKTNKSRQIITNANANSNANSNDEYILVDGAKPPPPPFPPPPPPSFVPNSSPQSLQPTQPSMGAVLNEMLGGSAKLKKVSDLDKNKFKRKKKSKSNTRGSYTPSLDEIVKMRKSLRRNEISKSRMDYLKLDN